MAKKLFKGFLIIVVSILFLLSAYSMLSGNKAELELLSELGLSAYGKALSFISIVIAISLWIKKTRYIAVFVGTAYLGGAIASELSIGDIGLIPGLTMLALWIIWRMDKRRSAPKNLPQSADIVN